jgi:raffinose/stachyose/melibiose transport system substrate-binding protein
MRRFDRWTAATVAACLALVAPVVTACGGDDDGGGGGGENTLTWWHNANTDPGKAFWQTIADEFVEEHPDLQIEVVPMQNEEFQTEIPIALRSDDPPDLFQQWGGGQMREQVEAGRLRDITEDVEPAVDEIGLPAENWQVDGRQYGLPYTFGLVGFWYNEDLFAEAGIDAPPETWDDFLAAVDDLKAADITPIALGGQDRWPDAFYWAYLALRLCDQGVMEGSATEFDFEDPCWVEAGERLQQLIDAEPFNEGFLATPAQQGAGSSAGLLGNGEAAMELQGHWNIDIMNGLTEDEQGLGDSLGWFPFPALPGGDGDPDAALGGGDGFSCTADAPLECAEFLAYILSPEVQTRWGELGIGMPVREGSEESVTDPNLQRLLEFRGESPYIQSYLDIAYGTTVGQALNDAIAEQFAGTLSPEEVVDAVETAAAER